MNNAAPSNPIQEKIQEAQDRIGLANGLEEYFSNLFPDEESIETVNDAVFATIIDGVLEAKDIFTDVEINNIFATDRLVLGRWTAMRGLPEDRERTSYANAVIAHLKHAAATAAKEVESLEHMSKRSR